MPGKDLVGAIRYKQQRVEQLKAEVRQLETEIQTLEGALRIVEVTEMADAGSTHDPFQSQAPRKMFP